MVHWFCFIRVIAAACPPISHCSSTYFSLQQHLLLIAAAPTSHCSNTYFSLQQHLLLTAAAPTSHCSSAYFSLQAEFFVPLEYAEDAIAALQPIAAELSGWDEADESFGRPEALRGLVIGTEVRMVKGTGEEVGFQDRMIPSNPTPPRSDPDSIARRYPPPSRILIQAALAPRPPQSRPIPTQPGPTCRLGYLPSKETR